jgi:hypothetical protein
VRSTTPSMVYILKGFLTLANKIEGVISSSEQHCERSRSLVVLFCTAGLEVYKREDLYRLCFPVPTKKGFALILGLSGNHIYLSYINSHC